MSKTMLDERFHEGDVLINKIRDEQLERLRRVGDLWQGQLADWEDLAKAEDNVKREYTGRYLFELLQNANDAILDWYELRGISIHNKPANTRNRVRLQLSPKALLIGNDGLPFTDSNIRALCRLHISTKSASKQIGHKGIGFKSVLEITDSPEVYSDRFAFGFNQHEFESRVNEIIRSNAQKIPLPILRAPFQRRLSWLSQEERVLVEEFFDQDFVTVVRLPFNSNELQPKVMARIREVITPQLLLFLEAIDQLEIFFPSGENYAYWRTEVRSHVDKHSRDVILYSDESGTGEIHSRWLVLDSKELTITDRSLVDGLGDAWQEVHAVRYSAAFPVSSDGTSLLVEDKSKPFYVYFPTEEYSGIRFLINADFYLGSARKEIDSCTLNNNLAEEIAIYIASDGVDTLKRKFPKDPAIVDILSLVQGKPDRQFSHYFYEQYLLALSESDFVPIDGGHYKTPSEIRFTPEDAEVEQFRQFFPPNYLRGDQKWAYPLIEVYFREADRERKGLGFLLKLGTQALTQDDVIKILQLGSPTHIQDQGAFIRFLANWWDETPWYRSSFTDELANCPIVPTQDGWRIPSKTLIFQANLRQEKTPKVPRGFAFSVVPLKIYGDDRAYDGVTARFLTALKVGPYVARDIIRRAILPKLRDEKNFKELLNKHQQSIYDAYEFLRFYFERDGSTTDFAKDLPKVPVPVYPAGDLASRIWKPAGEVYFSQFWTNSGDLEYIFDGFHDIFFLGKINEIEGLDDPEQKTGWYQFFYWLGVAYIPRLIDAYETYDIRNIHQHPFRDQTFWEQYTISIQNEFMCSNIRRNHGYSRVIEQNYRLDHFNDIVVLSNPDKSIRLFQILGRNWEKYRNHLSCVLRCAYTTTGCPSEIIPSYLGYCFSKIEWLPAEVGGKLTERLFCSRDIWNLGDDVRPEVKRMVPSLPAFLQTEETRAIRNDILRIDYSFDDYLSLLQRLPEIYPSNPSELQDDALKKWQEAIRAVFNWICQALQNILARTGVEDRPDRPNDLIVYAFRDNQPGYVQITEERLVYPDDLFLSTDWEKDLWYLKIDDNWGALRDWLKIPPLSTKVKIELIQSNKIEDQTKNLTEIYLQTIPYFLCLVRDKQGSRYDGILGRLKRLSIFVVDELQIVQSLDGTDLPPKFVRRPVYLQTRDESTSRGAMILRSGDLFVATTSVGDPYILGDPVASYIDIDRLADAFVLLFRLQGHEEKMRYLQSKGLSDGSLQTVIDDLKAQSEGQDASSIQGVLDKLFGGEGRTPITHTAPGATPPRELVLTPGSSEGEQGTPSPTHADPGAVTGGTSQANGHRTSSSTRSRGRLRTYVLPANHETTNTNYYSGDESQSNRNKEVDEAGISRVIADEKKKGRRAREMPHLNKGYDIESVDQSGHKRYIEVKSLSELWGQSNSPGMTRAEYEYARNKGENYWLYIVERATEENYKIYRIQNPALLVNQYLYDDGWRDLAEDEEE